MSYFQFVYIKKKNNNKMVVKLFLGAKYTSKDTL